MSHSRRNKQYLQNVLIGGSAIVTPSGIVTVGSDLVRVRTLPQIAKETIRFSALPIAVTDSGGANGGTGSKDMLTFPGKRIQAIGGVLALSSVVAAAGINAAATVKFAVGTAANTNNDTLAGAEADIIASQNCVLAGSIGLLNFAGGPLSLGTMIGLYDFSAGTTHFFLNLGVADAGITTNSVVTITGEFSLFYVELL